MYRLHERLELNIDIEIAWKFFSNPHNLSKITPPELDFQITDDVPDKIYAGMIIRYSVRPLFRVPVLWVTEITHAKENEFFVDEQRIGPYKMWHHQHLFHQTQTGVLVEDIVDYALPFGPIGVFTHATLVQRQLRKIFDFRREQLKKLFPDR